MLASKFQLNLFDILWDILYKQFLRSTTELWKKPFFYVLICFLLLVVFLFAGVFEHCRERERGWGALHIKLYLIWFEFITHVYIWEVSDGSVDFDKTSIHTKAWLLGTRIDTFPIRDGVLAVSAPCRGLRYGMHRVGPIEVSFRTRDARK